MSITNKDAAELAIEGLGALVVFVIDSVRARRIDPLEARQLLEDRMTDIANQQIRKELGD